MPIPEPEGVDLGQRAMRAYKLFRVRKDGTLGSLFIGRRARLPVGEWLKAAVIPTPGFQVRGGWHCCATPEAPHLTIKGRVWCEVMILGVSKHLRPPRQGGLWYTADRMKIVEMI